MYTTNTITVSREKVNFHLNKNVSILYYSKENGSRSFQDTDKKIITKNIEEQTNNKLNYQYFSYKWNNIIPLHVIQVF